MEEIKINSHLIINSKISSKWYEDGCDFIIDIGNMKKAIVVAYYVGGYYSISPRSYFPFSKFDYEQAFKNPVDCIKYSEIKFLEWVNSCVLK